MSKYSDKTFDKILGEMPNRVKECDALEEILFIRTYSIRYGVSTL